MLSNNDAIATVAVKDLEITVCQTHPRFRPT